MFKPSALLIEGDCLNAMQAIPTGSVNLILCDLPYGTTQNPWDSIIPLDELWKQYKRILSANGAIILTSQGAFTAKLILSQEQMFKYKLTWIKSKSTNFLNAKKQPLRKHEDICVFYSKQPNYKPQMTFGDPYDKGVRKDQLTGSYGEFKPAHIKSDGWRYPTDVIYFKTAESEGRVWHPTQKPIELGRYLVRTYSNPGDVVLDNCFGSASFLVSAAQEDRHALGIELNSGVAEFKKIHIDLIDVAQERLASYAKVNLCRSSAFGKISEKLSEFMRETYCQDRSLFPNDTDLQLRSFQQCDRSIPASQALA